MSIIVDGEQLDFNVARPKKKLFINVSNHPSSTWSVEQKQAALEGGRMLVDIPFPNVPPTVTRNDIKDMGYELIHKIDDVIANYGGSESTATITIVGEFSLTIFVIVKLRILLPGLNIVVATSERNTVINEDGSKTISFEFVQFRQVL